MCWQMKNTFQIILELIPRKIRRDIRIIAIAPGGENNQPFRDYSVRKPQVKK